MRNLSPKSLELERLLNTRGYPREVSAMIAGELSTDFTASRMLGYLRYNRKPSLTELADEMLSILSLRETIINNKVRIASQRTINEVLRYGLGDEDDETEQ